ncbi:F-box protein Pof14 [Schizosaccharomyces japonicus yFS275]|uniref:F-box protein Pof14 n=1 Tax=Schizosaccharomyces japonicus (strain yFS275 / FY16936) TaxID=402676 RepID=B6JZK4_SCHJY|nr:F-box protein Pof14 [Schizosaccharomyces japonicus yFS275]EEB06972.1 F-box protein Pof14 [Schizosaccharomyces japonicus yFS275]
MIPRTVYAPEDELRERIFRSRRRIRETFRRPSNPDEFLWALMLLRALRRIRRQQTNCMEAYYKSCASSCAADSIGGCPLAGSKDCCYVRSGLSTSPALSQLQFECEQRGCESLFKDFCEYCSIMKIAQEDDDESTKIVPEHSTAATAVVSSSFTPPPARRHSLMDLPDELLLIILRYCHDAEYTPEPMFAFTYRQKSHSLLEALPQTCRRLRALLSPANERFWEDIYRAHLDSNQERFPRAPRARVATLSMLDVADTTPIPSSITEFEHHISEPALLLHKRRTRNASPKQHEIAAKSTQPCVLETDDKNANQQQHDQRNQLSSSSTSTSECLAYLMFYSSVVGRCYVCQMAPRILSVRADSRVFYRWSVGVNICNPCLEAIIDVYEPASRFNMDTMLDRLGVGYLTRLGQSTPSWFSEHVQIARYQQNAFRMETRKHLDTVHYMYDLVKKAGK